MLKHRLPIGALMIGLLLGALWVDDAVGRLGPLPAGLVILLVALALVMPAARELATIVRAKALPTCALVLAGGAAAGLIAMYLVAGLPLAGASGAAALAAVGGTTVVAAMARQCLPGRRCDGALAAGAVASMSFVYLGLLPGFFLLIRQGHGVWTLAGVILVIKACDIGAYFTGRAVGRRKLIPWLSPGKTWEGLAGGLALAGLAALGLAAVSNATGQTGQWVVADGQRAFEAGTYPLVLAALAGAVLGLVGQAGDLLASALKRDAGIKDAGQSIPGFGGVIDVIDSPLLAAPVAWVLIALLLAS